MREIFPQSFFLPTDCLGSDEDWSGANNPPRPLMRWDDVRALAEEGASFGSHSLNHANLTQLDSESLDAQLAQSRTRLEEELGAEVSTFAAPYGAVNDAVIQAIAKHYAVAAGTRFDRATRADDICDIPRLEMHYYRDPVIWRKHLEGRGGSYMAVRKFARKVRQAMQ